MSPAQTTKIVDFAIASAGERLFEKMLKLGLLTRR